MSDNRKSCTDGTTEKCKCGVASLNLGEIQAYLNSHLQVLINTPEEKYPTEYKVLKQSVWDNLMRYDTFIRNTEEKCNIQMDKSFLDRAVIYFKDAKWKQMLTEIIEGLGTTEIALLECKPPPLTKAQRIELLRKRLRELEAEEEK